MTVIVLALVAGVVLVPLGGEYADLRRSHGFGRAAAFGTTGLVFPALAVGIALAFPLDSRPALQWTVTVAATLAAYSLATRAILSSASAAGTAPSRNTSG